uniref:Uncharacterized protein n=1 Tax=Romanomermis culicivorax TaxID=13658 RepID=A0A915J430_ROMCU
MVWFKVEKSFNFKSFCRDVTVSGLANFLETKDSKCKLFWIVANVACILSAVALCYNTIAYYLANEVKTTMKVISQDSKPNFPAITFCTTSLMRTSRPLKLNGTGQREGFKFLLNVHQEEYCTPYNVYNGTGFLFGLKENYAPYDFNCDKGFLKISIGSDVNINVKPTKFIRNTEHLKKCTNKPLVDYEGKHPIPYYRGFCLVAELVKLFYHTCHCILPSYDFYTPYMNHHNFEFSGFPNNLTKEIICDKNPKFSICVSILMQKFYFNKLWQILPLCPLPCFETVYTITFSMKKLSWNSLKIEKSVDSALVEGAYHNATSYYYDLKIGKLEFRNSGTKKQKKTISNEHFIEARLAVSDKGSGRVKRVENGIEIKPHSMPWLGLLNADGKSCGSFLIDLKPGAGSSDIMLMAAHCFDKVKDSSNIVVYLGKHNKYVIE